ncbi:LOG family protein [Amycolatopsis pithecellobii]|uniref:LOG family protein n=1 Tax=Amycolatopsis pithecellobii TaxID=664692 RepID=UPI00140DC1BD|nr:TIGR00730 family Rossman fold protein [Amycolatopsis pithecellobii]
MGVELSTEAVSLAICVFCGASQGDSPVYTEAGYQLGKQLGSRFHRLIYGAGGVGVMGAVARGAAEYGAKIVGVIPSFLREREMGDDIPPQEIIITTNLAHRKTTMMNLADGFIGLPGGYGTMDEMFEVISMSALGVERRPVVLVNTNGFWDLFLELVDELGKRRFLPEDKYFIVVDDPAEAIDRIEFARDAR